MKQLLHLIDKTHKSLLVIFICLLISLPAKAAESELVNSLKKHPASIHLESQNVSLLFKAISRQAGINIYVAENITDTITIELQDRSLYDVFQIIIEAKNLRYFEKNGLLFIQKEEDFQAKKKDIQVKRICTKFGSAADYESQLAVLLSDAGSITIADRGNCLVIKDQTDNLDRIKTVLGELDRPIPQVYIEARIVVISQEAKKRLGIKWGFADTYTVDGRDMNVTFASDQSVVNNTSIEIGFVKNPLNLTMELQALQQEDLLQILSSPSVLVLDGKEAEIKQGKEVAYVTQTDNTISTSFREANLGLKVTPKILKDKYIVLDLSVTNDSVSTTSTGGQPTIDTQEITSTLFLENGVTVVIGGIQLENSSINKGKVPMLSELPLLGSLFKSKSDTNTNYELQVFITPTIVSMKDAVPYLNEDNSLPPQILEQTGEKTEVPSPIKEKTAAVSLHQSPVKTVDSFTEVEKIKLPEDDRPVSAPSSSPGVKSGEAKKIIEEPTPKKVPVKPALSQVTESPSVPEPEEQRDEKVKLDESFRNLVSTNGRQLYTVQVGAFLDGKKAEALLGELQAKGYSLYIAELKDKDNKMWFTIRIGEFNGWQEASMAAAEFIKNEKRPGVVLPKDSLYGREN